MATVIECVLPKNSVLLCVSHGQKGSMQRIFIKKCFLFAVGSICRLKQFSLEGTCFPDEEVETEVWKWLRQQTKDFYAAGFDALVKRWDELINVGGGYVEKYIFFRFKYHVF
jgi:hypothetical protein